MNPFFQLCLDNAATATVAGKREILVSNAAGQTLFIRGVIAPGFEANAADVVAAISKADPTRDLQIHFNTPGGSVFEGKEIAAAIRNFPGKTIANIVSLCASAGTSIAIACSEVVMQRGAFFMIHNAQGAAFGDKTALRDTADLMEKVELTIVDDYMTKTGKLAEEIVAMMEAETWMTAAEALESGFIDRIAGGDGVSNTWNLSAYAKPPAELANAAPPASAPAPKPEPDPEPTAAPPAEAIVNSMTQANRNRLTLLQATS
jgi:ATP-dependent protease ClpP protease subunit